MTRRGFRFVGEVREEVSPTPTAVRPAPPECSGLQQRVTFCQASDAVHLAVAIAGRGTPLVKTANWLNHIEFDWQSPVSETASRLLHVIGDIDVTELLPHVAVPTLVVHSRGDARVPFEHGLRLAREIRDARFVALESKNHLILSHEPAWPRFIDAITEFLRAEEAPSAC